MAFESVARHLHFARDASQRPHGVLRLNTSFVAYSALDVKGRLVFDEMRSVLDAVLERHSAPGEAFHLYFPHRAQMPGKLRAFVDFMREANSS